MSKTPRNHGIGSDLHLESQNGDGKKNRRMGLYKTCYTKQKQKYKTNHDEDIYDIIGYDGIIWDIVGYTPIH